MKLIAFDLETSDLNRVGQILFSFISFDAILNDSSRPAGSSMKQIATGKIRIENTQLPVPEAIVANRINVLEHQADPNLLSEKDAMLYIAKEIENIASNSEEPVLMFGYNSVKFDLPYLRTSMIRNGINPYFKNVIYSDVLFLVQYLAATNKDIHNLLRKTLDDKLHLTLNNVYKTLTNTPGLEYEQSHDAFKDVIDTIRLSESLRTRYGLNIATFNTYPQKVEIDAIYNRITPNYNLLGDSSIKTPMILFDDNYNYSLWIDLRAYEQGAEQHLNDVNAWAKRTDYPDSGKATIKWFNKKYGPLFLDKDKATNSDSLLYDLGKPAVRNLKRYHSLENFFPPKNCDILQHIYMMPIKDIDYLRDAIHHHNEKKLIDEGSSYAAKLYLRYKFNTSLGTSKIIDQEFLKYCDYRYNGKMKIDSMDTTSVYEEGIYEGLGYGQIAELGKRTKEILINSKNKETDKLMESLLKFYNDSLIFKTLRASGKLYLS